MITPDGELRPHYDTFVRSLETLGRHELASRWENAKRAIRDNGVTYNVYGDPEGVDRPWTLDMIPLLVPPAEWNHLEAALIQRAHVLNLLLGDLYGPQRLLHERQLPPSLVFGNPGFLRPCHGIAVPRGIHLHLHAVDLARSPDGQWWVLADRTQAPSGAGYTLENRIVLSRSLPEAFRDCQVQRLASFFWAQRDTLTALASAPRDTPRVVLLTPGPLNETYFEHAYLARYLGFTLVEGGDLTVRDRRVFIKTLDGLQPVDVIFRRLDDSFCDPLELRTDSTLGVAGLVEAARAGNVTIANALGSGAIETAAMSRFLPSLCRSLLGEELLLPSVPTRWCGDAGDLQYVLEHLDRMVIKRTFPPITGQPIFGRLLSTLQRSALVSEIRAQPGSVRRSGRDAALDRTCVAWAETRPAPARAAHVRGRGRRLVCGHAWRTHAHRRARRCADCVHAARRWQQGHVGAHRRSGQPDVVAGVAVGQDSARAAVRRSSEPRGRQPVLARTICRARRTLRARAAQRRRRD